jgi:hypothetical protein
MAAGGVLGFATIPRTLRVSGDSLVALLEPLASDAGEEPGLGKNPEAATEPAMTQP